MEASGGEPDVIGRDEATGRYIFCDCSSRESARAQESLLDREALNSRKENRPAGSAIEMAAAMGIELLTEKQYREPQQLDEFDRKTSSWIVTPEDVRCSAARFCDRRYGRVFVYHNGRSRTTLHGAFVGCCVYERVYPRNSDVLAEYVY